MFDCRGDDEPQGDEGYVHRDQVDRSGQLEGITGVQPFHDDDPRVLPQLVAKLAVANIHGVDLLRAPLEHAVGEPAGGRSHVQDRHPANFNAEGVQSVGQLDPSPANVRESAPDVDGGVTGQQGTGLQYTARPGKDQPLGDQGLGLLPAFGQPLFH